MKLAANLAELLRKTSAMSFKVSEYHGALSTDFINALATNHVLTALAHDQIYISSLCFHCYFFPP